MKQTTRLFVDVLRRPLAALAALTGAEPALKAPLILFFFYTVIHSFILPSFPPEFIPEAPAAAFRNPFYYYLSAIPVNLAISALMAAFLPKAAAFFSTGRIAARIAASAGILIAAFTAAWAGQKTAALAWLLPSAFALLAALAFHARRRECRAALAVILAASAVQLALLPAEILAVALNSKPFFEIAFAVETVWILWLLVKALGLMGYTGVPRAAAAVLFTAALCGALTFGLAKLLPDRLAAILLLC